MVILGGWVFLMSEVPLYTLRIARYTDLLLTGMLKLHPQAWRHSPNPRTAPHMLRATVERGMNNLLVLETFGVFTHELP